MKTIKLILSHILLLMVMLFEVSPACSQTLSGLPDSDKQTIDDNKSITYEELLKKQIIRYITFPKVFNGQMEGRIVVVSFRVSKEGNIKQVEVHSKNVALNRHITSCLAGRKLHLSAQMPESKHLIRLHFQQV